MNLMPVYISFEQLTILSLVKNYLKVWLVQIDFALAHF